MQATTLTEARLNARCRHCGTRRSVRATVTRDHARGGRVTFTAPLALVARVLNDDALAVGPCACGKRVLFRKVRGTYAPGKHCDARCESAIGPACECGCAGANHGARWGA